MKRYVTVKVHPRAKRQHVEKHGENSYEVWTTAAPDRGEANEAVRKLLADAVGTSPSRLTLVRGATARVKLFELVD
jgi:uncharacterized protein YggU (UPF0235/DUF167 family)